MAARTDVSATLGNKVYFNTFGGNPTSMTQGLATMEVIDAEGIQEHALKLGGYLSCGSVPRDRRDRRSTIHRCSEQRTDAAVVL
jgi:acetylornithine/succinyldiaminopimelate/putrescine aminotransferase